MRGMSAFTIVGLGDTSIQESKQRIRSAIKNSDFEYPRQKKIINLAPANLKKQGPHFDLPIATSLLVASKTLSEEFSNKTIIIGELALDGSLRSVNGVLTMAVNIAEQGWKRIIIPDENMSEASLIKKIRPDLDLQIFTISHFRELQNEDFFSNPKELLHTQSAIIQPKKQVCEFDNIQGHQFAKRALKIAAAGGHHILFIGYPGIGKTLLAKALQSILPPLTAEEQFEVLKIHSSAGLIKSNQMVSERPFRQVHPSSSLIALIGGGINLKPGEITLAHNGVLFMDEMAEFPRNHLENLRQPMENKEIFISRASGTIRMPANFMLVASMNPCPCGYYGDRKKQCICRPYQIMQYQKKLSGPIMDRIDMVIRIEGQNIVQEKTITQSETTDYVTNQISDARKQQHIRFNNQKSLNSQMNSTQITKYCPLDDNQITFLQKATERFNLSGRGQHQIIRIARTIADLEQHPKIQLTDLAEAMQLSTSKNGFYHQ